MSGALSSLQGTVAAIPVSIGYYPPEGSRAMTASYSWIAQRQYNEDLSFAAQASGGMQTIQTVYIDNSQVEFPISLLIRGTNQRIVVPGGCMGLFPVAFGEGARCSIAGVLTTGEGSIGSNVNDNVTTVVWLNVPCNGSIIWSVTPGSWGYSMGAQTGPSAVTDPASGGILVTVPGDCRLVVASVSTTLTFTTPPTSAGAARVTLNDGNHIIANGRFSYAIGQSSATVLWQNLNYLARAVGGTAPFVNVTGFPAGASGGLLETSTLYTLIPQIIGS